MKARLFAASAAWLALAGPVRAGNDAANDFDHVHVSAPEPAKAAEWYLRLIGGTKLEQADRIAFGKTLVIFVQRQGTALGSEGTSLDHIGFSFPNLAEKMKELHANGVKVVAEPRALRGLYRSAFIEDPWGTKIEILEDPAALGFHHVHLRSPDPAAVR
jgi:catechol 2,3-dioxygenase-like lactoylglutathione lyase family enzyme